MNIFERLQSGEHIDIRDEEYIKQAHGEMSRCRQLCFEINGTPPKDPAKIIELENQLFSGQMKEGTFFTPPFQADIACCVKLGKNVFANHGLTMMSLGGIEIEDGVMIGPEAGLFTVNHEPENIRILIAKKIHIKKNAWIGARVCILPGVTIGENAIIGTGSIVTKDVPDNAIAVGNPAKVIKFIK